MKKYTILSPEGKKIRGTIPALAAITGFRTSNLRSLVAGCFSKFLGYCSMHPKVRRQRKRFMTVLVHLSTGRRAIVGESVAAFSRRHQLTANEVYALLNGKSICYRGWMLETTYLLTHPRTTLGYF